MNKEKETFGLPKKTIEKSLKQHKKGAQEPLEERRQDIIREARRQRRRNKVRPLLIAAAAASLVGFLVWSVILQTSNPSSFYAQSEVEQILYELNQNPDQADQMIKNTENGSSEMDWSWSNKVNLSGEEINHMLQEWSVEMSENEIYNLQNL